ncbi:SurA-like chaperone / peptidyl-prolyl cis-trans isomerase [Campylobacter iguaniorum]|uniref:peptidylprolyl isomerase n=1 Tax=Campylobacter iguaniorum TaxID=1244531 RepID=UPI0007C925CC|nr:peptidylprolyl isomerase [Campylobacter iguaniorum]ANE35662.1 SurA-like chaperone / peptidyl-prolyl cis-trans isomerase [Campylobacter iguaniorum]
MKKGLALALSLAAAMSLNAAVLATVNGQNITDEDLAPALGSHMSELEKIPAEMKKNLLDRVIERQLMVEQAKKDGINQDPEYKKAIADITDNVAVNIWMKKQFEGLKVDEKKVKDFYEKNKDKYVVPAQVKAKHILVASEKEAKDIIKSLNGLKGDALDKKFSQIAKEKSIDKSSAQNGGELGWFGESQMVPSFGKASFELKKGEMTKQPVQSEFGYHIILKEDSKPQTALAYDKVKGKIETQLKTDEFRNVMQKKVDELKKAAKIEYK